MRASGLHVRFLPVVAEGAFEGAPVAGIAFDHSEGAGNYAIGAAVADVRLNVNAAELSAYDGAGWAGFQASRILAVLADVGRK